MNVHQISADSPDMSDQEAIALRESIASIGQQVPILLWHGDVIDGRKRLAACHVLGREPITQTVPDDGDPVQFAGALNLLRTHYTLSQRAAYAERLANVTIADTSSFRKSAAPSSNLNLVTRADAARRMGVSKTALNTARVIRRTAAPEVIQAVERGKLTLHAAEVIATKVPHAEQPKVVEEVIAGKKGKRNAPAKVINVAAPGRKRIPRRDAAVVRERSLRSMAECAAALDQFMEYEITTTSDIQQWRQWVRDIITTLRTFNKRIEAAHERTA